MSTLIETSVIMPTYNKSTLLNLTLAGFTLQSIENFEIVIIDDGSTCDNESVINQYKNKLNIKYQYCSQGGRSHARNVGLEMAEGKYIIFSDDDRIPSPKFLEEHINILKKDKQKITIGSKKEMFTQLHREFNKEQISQWEPFNQKYQLQYDIATLEKSVDLVEPNDLTDSFVSTIEKWLVDDTEDNSTYVYDKYTDALEGFEFGWALATTGNMGYCREHFPDIYFDEDFQGWGVEDTDFAYQLYKQGGSFYYIRNAISYHQIHSFSSGKWKECRQNLAYFGQKYKCIEVYIFLQIFDWGINKYNIVKANETLLNYKAHIEEPLAEDFLRVSDLYAHFLTKWS